MQALTDRIAVISSSEPENAARASAFLLLVYAATLVPLLTWSLYTFLDMRRKKVEAETTRTDVHRVLAVPSPEEAALLIRHRRSIFTKDFSGAPVDRNVVESMLEAANWAPTHGKTEPWRFSVLSQSALQDFIGIMISAVEASDSPKKDEKIAKLNSKRRKLAPVAYALVICYKRQAGEKLMPEWEELAATAAAVQNMHLMATAFGVAGYWTSWGPEDARDSGEVKRWLGLSPEDKCIGVFLLGASDRREGYRSSRGPISEKVTWRE